jgi:hypothetical protein
MEKRGPIFKNSAGGVAQVVEHLPTKCEVLSSNSITSKKEKYKKEPFPNWRAESGFYPLLVYPVWNLF